MYLFFFNRLFSASQSKCHFVSTLEENVANRVLKCYFIYSMDSGFFNITCKSNQRKKKSSAPEMGLLYYCIFQTGLKLGTEMSCKEHQLH